MSKTAADYEAEARSLREHRRSVTRGLGRLLGRTGSSQPLRRSVQDIINNPEMKKDFHRGFKEGQTQRGGVERSS